MSIAPHLAGAFIPAADDLRAILRAQSTSLRAVIFVEAAGLQKENSAGIIHTWLKTPPPPMSDETIQLLLVLAFLMFAAISLGAAAFIRLVALLLSNGSKVEAVEQAVRQVQTHLSNGTEPNTSSPMPSTTLTTPECPPSSPTGPITGTK